MPKILRKQQKIFGSSAGGTQIAQFGSLAAASPAYTADPDTIQSLANYLGGWFSAVIGANSPSIEDMNALCYLYAYQLAYLMQAGIAEWDANTTYYIGSFASDGLGGYYQSLTNNNTGNALTDPVNWVQSTGPQRIGAFLVQGVSDEVQHKVLAAAAQTASILQVLSDDELTTYLDVLSTRTFAPRLVAGTLPAGATLAQFTAYGPETAFNATANNTNTSQRMQRCNGTLAAPTAVASGEPLVTHSVRGHDGTIYKEAVLDLHGVGGPVSAGVVPGYWEKYVADLAGVLQLRLAIYANGLAKFGGPLVIGNNDITDPNLGTISSVENAKYYRGSFNYTFDAGAGFAANQVVPIRYVLDGSTVTVTLPATTAAADGVGQIYLGGTSQLIPTGLRPFQDVLFLCQIVDNGLKQAGAILFRPSGEIRVYSQENEGGSFTAAATCGWSRAITATFEIT